ncbi:MAG: enoyl-CoA hydratase/isomerase family protein, partial [Rhodospirillaceae bacterium]|nr:enoyl-CoA hydratase/isomerase family protein [Rhodospirillaceae bacterium]
MPVTIEPRGDLALVVIDNPPVNATSKAVRAGLIEAARQVDADAAVRGAILICRGRTFVAGGDVSEFDGEPQPPHLPDVVARIEGADKPWLAAMHGSAFGGGLELALGCRWRIAAAGTRLGLPEVTLGLIPGAGGTVRLSRVVAPELAARMASQGQPISAAAALEAGLLDAVVDGELEAEALSFLTAALAAPLPPRTLERPAPGDPGTAAWQELRAAAGKKLRGQGAPGFALQSVRNGLTMPAAEALAQEREIHLNLRKAPESKALRHVFFAERAALKAPVEAKPGPLKAAGVVGGGTMGAGIAVAFLDAGLPVTLLERDQAALDRGLAAVARILDGSVKRGRLAEADRDARWARLTGSLDAAALSTADVVVEAVFEDLEVKREVFGRLDAACKPGAVLATNTSYIDPNAIAAATSRPDAVVGLHFFSPANVMKLLEVVRTDKVSDETLATAWALARKLGKTPVLAGVCDGFIGNRILKRYRAAAEDLVRSGADIAEIDAAMRNYGFAMG